VFERFYLPALRRSPEWSLVGAVDAGPDRLRWLAGTLPAVAVADALPRLQDIGELDAVLIATPPDSHCALAAEALGRGAHVLIEKPLALRTAEAASVIALGRMAGRQVWVGFNRRFRPSYQQLGARLAELPPECYCDVAFELCSDPEGWRSVSGYLTDQERGGGLLDDIASHQLDLVPWLLGDTVREVRATREQRKGGSAVLIDLRFAGGVTARCRAGHLSPSTERLEVRTRRTVLIASADAWVSTPAATAPAAAAARRYLTARGLAAGALRRVTGRAGGTVESFSRQLSAWASAIRTGRAAPQCADGEAGARCVALVEACRHSLAGGGAWVVPRCTETSR
jgi:predicted dehydrogenase